MNGDVNKMIIIALMVSLVISFLVVNVYRNLYSGQSLSRSDVYDILDECSPKTGPIPDPDFSTCDQRCSFLDNLCLLAFVRDADGKHFEMGCETDLNMDADRYSSYNCICC
jgi:hypothetical protein